MSKRLSAAPVDLQVDEKNPRLLRPVNGQREAILAIAENQKEKLLALAEDLVEHGANPTDLPIVMSLPGSGTPRFVVLEGNRRLVALRALENPDLVADVLPASIVKKLRGLSRRYQSKPIDAFECVEFPSRDAASHWIELRHSNENKGAGTIRWGSDEAARYRGSADPHTQALNFLEARGDLTPERRAKLSVTNFERLLNTPEVRARLGVTITAGELQRLAGAEKVAQALLYVVNDLIDQKKKVSEIYEKKQRLKYARELPRDVAVTPSYATPRPLAADADDKSQRAAKGGTPAAKRSNTRALKKRDRLIPPQKDCVLDVTDPRVEAIVHELRKKLNLNDHPNAISVLFRVFVELSTDVYTDQHKLKGVHENSKLGHKIAAVATDLESKSKLSAQRAKAVRKAAADQESFLAPSLGLLHQYVHNQYIFPKPKELRDHWDQLQAFFCAVWSS